MKDRALKEWKYQGCVATMHDNERRATVGCNWCEPENEECIYWISLSEYYDIEGEIDG